MSVCPPVVRLSENKVEQRTKGRIYQLRKLFVPPVTDSKTITYYVGKIYCEILKTKTRSFTSGGLPSDLQCKSRPLRLDSFRTGHVRLTENFSGNRETPISFKMGTVLISILYLEMKPRSLGVHDRWTVFMFNSGNKSFILYSWWFDNLFYSSSL